ncbi:protoglobin domain-containing protein, partial [Rhodosalinus halophilus]
MDDILGERLELFRLAGPDQALVKQAGELLTEDLDKVLDRFHEPARSDERMSAFFADEQQVAHARDVQKAHWKRLLAGRFDGDYFESTRRVGQAYFRMELSFLLYLSCHARSASSLQAMLLRRIGRGRMAFHPGRTSAMLGALSRAFTMDIELVIDAYLQAQGKEQEIAFGYIAKAVQAISDGDLFHRIPAPSDSDYPEKFEAIRLDLHALAEGFTGLIGS